MSQDDMVVVDQSHTNFRAKLNSALQALVGKNWGPTEPTVKYEFMDWGDTTTGLLKMRNAANDAWITIGPLSNLISMAQLLTTQGDLIYASAANTPARLGKGTANTKLFMNAADTAPEWATGIKAGLFTRDTTLASGTQAVTGVGFKPSALLTYSIQDGTGEVAWGLVGVDRVAAGFGHQGSSIYTTAAFAFYDYEASGKAYAGNIDSYDSDGFTVGWTRTGTPSGTLTCYYLALR